VIGQYPDPPGGVHVDLRNVATLDAELLQLLVQTFARDAEAFGRFGFVVGVACQRTEHEFALEFIHRLLEGGRLLCALSRGS